MIYQRGASFLGCNVNSILYTTREICVQVMSKAKHGSSLRSILAKTRKEFKHHNFNIKLVSKRESHLETNEFYVNAYYDVDEDQNRNCAIEVIVHHNIEDAEFKFDQASQLMVQIYDAVVHEFKHQAQGRKRKYKPSGYQLDDSSNKSYLKDPDEIDAYALSIAIELIRNLGRTRSIQYLHRASQLAQIRPRGLYASPNLLSYFAEFEDTSNPIIRKLIKKVYLNLVAIDKSAIFY